MRLLEETQPEDVCAAAWFGLPFAAYLVVLGIVAPASDSQWSAADPILTLVPRSVALWSVPLLALGLALAWSRVAPPAPGWFRSRLGEAALGVGLAALGIGVLRLASGPVLPSFIPPEESAAPGFLLSMTAGYVEELVCRLGVLPLLYFFARKRLGRVPSSVLGLLGSALVFALWHAAGETEPSTAFFATRFLIPGCLMSSVWLFSPTAIVVGHSCAHLLIPLLFVPK